MRLLASLVLAVFLAGGCGGVVVIKHRMPPLLLPLGGQVHTIAVGTFAVSGKTPAHLGPVVADMLAQEIKQSPVYSLAPTVDRAQLVVSGDVSCRLVKAEIRRQFETVETLTADIAVTFRGTSGKALVWFAVTERPSLGDQVTPVPELPDEAAVQRELLRACVAAFVADVSPRTVAVRIPRPGPFSPRERTRRGIDLLTERPADAITALSRALRRDVHDAAALNALGFCSEVAGNLEQAERSYRRAVACEDREEHRENMERVQGLLRRRRALLGTGGPP